MLYGVFVFCRPEKLGWVDIYLEKLFSKSARKKDQNDLLSFIIPNYLKETRTASFCVLKKVIWSIYVFVWHSFKNEPAKMRLYESIQKRNTGLPIKRVGKWMTE